MGAPYRRVLDIGMAFRPGDVILEIGSDRGEGSTRFFADYAAELAVPFITIDFNPHVHAKVRELAGVEAICAKGEDVLRSWGRGNIRLAYLDNFDWWWGEDITPYEEHIAFGRKLYEPFGLEFNNANSQATHLQQAQLVHEHSDAGSVILFDDTWLRPDGNFDGKGGTAVPWLLMAGYRIIGELERAEVLYGGSVLLRRDD